MHHNEINSRVMSDEYKDIMTQVFKPAPDDMVTGFKRKMTFIQSNFPHSEKTVTRCLEGLSTKPTLVELMAAAYLVNGGLLFKHDEIHETEIDDPEYSKLLKEMDELHCAHAESPKATTSATDIDIFAEIE
jgi:hypothetical protein